MKFFFHMVLRGVFLIGVGVAAVEAQTDIGTLKKGVVKITAEFSNARKVGTGFVAAKGKKHLYIVTASHVIQHEVEDDMWQPAKSMTVTFFTHQEETFQAKIVKMEGGDPFGLALLKVKGDLPDDVQILSWDTTTQVRGGEDIQLIGFPRVGGNPWAVTKGTLSGFDGPVLKFSGAVAEGNFGGPVLYQGQVVGVVMEVTGQFGNAKPAQIAKFTVENWPGYPRHTVSTQPSPGPGSKSNKVSSPSVAPQPGMATLIVETTPADAQVFVDDEFVGQTGAGPLMLRDLEPDEYDVMVRKDGFRSWDRTIDLRAGDQRTMTATLRAGTTLTVTGAWRNPTEPAIYYILQQEGNQVAMAEMTTNLLGAVVVTAQGNGQLQGNQLQLTYQKGFNLVGETTTVLSDDGQRLLGTYLDHSTMTTVGVSFIRIGDIP